MSKPFFQAMTNSIFSASGAWNGASSKCLEDINKVNEGLKKFEMWSLQMVDASTKIPNGILMGNLIDLGNYDECLSIQSPVEGRHCMAQIATQSNYLNSTPTFSWSYCIPGTCSPEELTKALDHIFGSKMHANISVSENDCNTSASTELSSVDIFAIIFFGLILTLCLLSTIYDVTWKNKHNKKSNGLLSSFSFYTNGLRLLKTTKTDNSITSLFGMRFLSMAWIILGHRYFFNFGGAVANQVDILKAFKRLDLQLIAGANLGVDTFFLMSGFLNALSVLKLIHTTHRFPYFMYYVHRYIRTTPALAAIILVYVSVYNLIGDGPLWERTTGTNRDLCYENWWPTLLYINNYYNPVSQCAGQSWYLAVDMQLYWLSPLVILPCWKWPKITKFYLVFLLVISTITSFTVAYVNDIKMPFALTADMDEYLKITREIYVPTHARATPYIMGIMLGFYISNLQKSDKKILFSRMTLLVGWTVSTALSLSVILGNYPFMQSEADHPYNALESSFYICLNRIAWCCSLIWIIVVCVSGYGGIVNAFLSWNFFIPLSRLTYSMFLCHLAVQQYQLGIARISGYYQDFDVIYRFFGDLVMTTLFSIVLTLMFESPFMVLEKELGRKKPPQMIGVTNEGYLEDNIKELESGVFRNKEEVA